MPANSVRADIKYDGVYPYSDRVHFSKTLAPLQRLEGQNGRGRPVFRQCQ